MPPKAIAKERRRSSRLVLPSYFAINLLEPAGLAPVDHVNISEGGLCLRLPAMLEVKSLIRFQLASHGGSTANRLHPTQCTGRVAWVTQRLDLRNMPPYLFDIGVELVKPPRFLGRLLAHKIATHRKATASSSRLKLLTAADIHGRLFVPRLVRDGDKAASWHLIVSVDDSPCFSQHFGSERAAHIAWMQFQRKQARTRRVSS